MGILTSKWLVFSCVGPHASTLTWLSAEFPADVAICYYDDNSLSIPFARYSLRYKGYKFPAFFELLKKHPEILDYDYFLWADDDIISDPSSVVRFMQLTEALKLPMAQPSLSGQSAFSWPHLVNKPSLQVEFTGFIEIQFFAISNPLLRLCLPYWEWGYTGYGMDLIAQRLRRKHKMKAAVIHEVAIHHPHRDFSQTVHSDPAYRSKNAEIIAKIQAEFGRIPSLTLLKMASDRFRAINSLTVALSLLPWIVRRTAHRVRAWLG